MKVTCMVISVYDTLTITSTFEQALKEAATIVT